MVRSNAESRMTHNVDTSSLEGSKISGGRCDVSGSVSLNEEDGLFAKVVVILEPVENVVEEERLSPNAAGYC